MEKIKLTNYQTPDELAVAVAGAWVAEIEAANRAGKPHYVALAGGRIVKSFYAQVVKQSGERAVSLTGVHFFWGDERCVPPEDVESNYRLAREFLFDPLQIAPGQIHRIRGEAPGEAAASAAEEICRVVPLNRDGQPVLDIVFLGMGEDGHVASLFPGEPESVTSSKAVYRKVIGSKPPPERITLGYSTLFAAKQIWVLASGGGKEGALRESLRPCGRTPLAHVLAAREQTCIFTDIKL